MSYPMYKPGDVVSKEFTIEAYSRSSDAGTSNIKYYEVELNPDEVRTVTVNGKLILQFKPIPFEESTKLVLDYVHPDKSTT